MRNFAYWIISHLRIFSGLGVFVLFALVTSIKEHPDRLTKLLPFFIISFSIDVGIALLVTKFTFRNYDKIKSKSKRWQRDKGNSKKARCFGVFVQSLLTFWSLLALVVGIICLIRILCYNVL